MVLTVLLSLLVGVSLSLLGGGGSILTVPILLYAAHLEPHQAIVASLFVVGTTSAIGSISHARHGRVDWRTGLLFSVGGVSGAFAGGRLGAHLPGLLLLMLFTAMMLITGIFMLRGREPKAESNNDRAFGWLLLEGFFVGGFTGMVGAGGGFLVVPALVYLAKLPIKRAIGTSLLVIALKSFAAMAGYMGRVPVPWPITLAVAAAAIVGSLLGARLVGHIAPRRLRTGFAWFVLAMAVVILVRELGPLLAG
jgi:hypothetical protein